MKERKKEKTSGCIPALVVIVLLIGVSGGALHYLGKLQPCLDRIRQALDVPPHDFDQQPVEDIPELKELSLTPDPTVQPPAEKATSSVETVPVTKKTARSADSKLAAHYREKFAPPAIGSRIILTLKAGTKLKGRIKTLTPKEISVQQPKVSMTILRTQLSPLSLAMCYENSYVKYMVALHKRQQADRKAQTEYATKMKEEYQQYLALQRQRNKKQKSATSAKKTAASSKTMDYAKWMATQDESDFAKARRQRIAQYEAERQTAGREY